MKEMNLPIIAILALAAVVASAEILTECPSDDPAGTSVHIAHEFDCTKFYKCFMGEKYEKDCNSDNDGNKLYFNPELQACDYPWNVTCENNLIEMCPPEGSSQTPLLSHECNCFKHYECYNGQAIAKTCQPGQLFDYSLKKCVQAEKATCKSGTSRMYSIDMDVDPIFQCPPKGSGEDKLIPHECLCYVYFRCVDGEPIRKLCPTGTGFDYEKQECSIEYVNCTRPIPKPTTSTTTTTTTTPKPEEPKCHECDYCTERLPYHCDCSLYYECANGKEVVKKCHPGLHFNPDLQMCDLPEYANCRSCQNCNPGDRYPHECICEKYYECSKDGMDKVLRECPPGKQFDKKRLVCDYADKVNCLPVCTAQTCCPGQRIPHECHCNEYYECTGNGTSLALRRCMTGYYYDYRRKVCDLSTRAKCWRGDCAEGELFPHENDCSMYYQCGENHKVSLQKCRYGYSFDCDLNRCVPTGTSVNCCVVIPPNTMNPENYEFLEDIL